MDVGYRKDMEWCRNYIETHLDEGITAADLADKLGYSFYHFCHVFTSCNSLSPGAYIRSRRLARAAKDILKGESVTETACNSGYETPAGFTKAFTKAYGVCPSAYREQQKGNTMLEPKFEKRAEFTAVGYVFKPEDEGVEIMSSGAYWLNQDFSSVPAEVYDKLVVPGHGEIGTWLHPAEDTGSFYYFFGPMVANETQAPDGMEVLHVPAAEYAIFFVAKGKKGADLADAVRATWKEIYENWFDESGYKFNHTALSFESYVDDETSIFVPVIKA